MLQWKGREATNMIGHNITHTNLFIYLFIYLFILFYFKSKNTEYVQDTWILEYWPMLTNNVIKLKVMVLGIGFNIVWGLILEFK